MTTRKLYSIDPAKARIINLATLNPTVKAIIKGLWRVSSAGSEDFEGITGDSLLEYCVDTKLWTTKQDREKYITTWAYYVKTLKQLGVIEVGTTSSVSSEEYLEEEEQEEA